MLKNIYRIGFVSLMCLSFMVFTADAQDKITGPWMWMIAQFPAGQGGAAVTDDDGLDDQSNGKVTEEDVAKNGLTKKYLNAEYKDDFEWTEGEIAATGGNNLNDMLNRIKLGPDGDINDYCSYAVINVKSSKALNDVTGRAGSDDSIKIWLNGDVVHKNAVNRGAGNFQDTFKVDIKRGSNVLMVKVCERGGGWSMFVGFDADLDYNLNFTGLPVEPETKLTTQWGLVKKSY